jgi:hypothetical protein
MHVTHVSYMVGQRRQAQGCTGVITKKKAMTLDRGLCIREFIPNRKNDSKHNTGLVHHLVDLQVLL